MSESYGKIVYIIQLDESWFFRKQYGGGIGKTIVPSFARLYCCDRSAKMALTRARRFADLPKAKIVPMRLNLEEVK